MFFATHICLPIVLANSVNAVAVVRGRRSLFTGREVLAIGSSGMLPDFADPHLYLDERLGSWTHTAWFVLGLAMVPLLVRLSPWRRWTGTVLACAVAAILHVGCDAISGGIRPFPPSRLVVGGGYVDQRCWLILDAVLFVAAVTTWYVQAHLARRGAGPAGPGGRP